MQQAGVLELRIAVDIAAAPDKVWDALVNKTDAWWLPDFYCAPHSRKIHLEAWPGGRMYEEADNDGGLLWYTVTAIEPPRSINFTGHLSPPYGGPATNLLHIQLSETGAKQTSLTLTNWVYGKVDEKMSADLESGWQMLFSSGLKAYIEED